AGPPPSPTRRSSEPGNSPSPASFLGSEAGTSVTINAGSYSVAESGPSGYTESDSAGCSGTIANGGSATCTITNDDQAATLTVIKIGSTHDCTPDTSG